MVDFLLVGGQQRPFYFRFSALSRLCDDIGISLSELSQLEQKLKVSSIEKILYYGLQAGYQKQGNGEGMGFTEADILDWLDEDFDLITRGMELFAQQIEAYTSPKTAKKKASSRAKKAKD